MKQISKFARFLAGLEAFQKPIEPPKNTSPELRARLLAVHVLNTSGKTGALQ